LKKHLASFKGFYLAIQINGILVCFIFGALGGGFWLDKTLGTTPWLMLISVGLGFLGSMYVIYKTVVDMTKP